MNIAHDVAHGLLQVLALFARLLLTGVQMVENGLRALMSTGGLSSELQTLLLIVLLSALLFACLRLLKGHLRQATAFTLVLTLAHTMEHLAAGV